MESSSVFQILTTKEAQTMERMTEKFFERLDKFLNSECEKAEEHHEEIVFAISDIAEAIQDIKEKMNIKN